MKKSVKWALIGASIAAGVGIGAAAVSELVTKTLVGEALDRQEPKLMQNAMSKLAGSGGLDPEEQKKIQAVRERFLARDYREIRITSFDGTELAAHYFEVPNAKRVLIAMHGWRSSWDRDFAVISSFWEECGCSVLYAEQRGQGQSGGGHMGFGLLERFDCLSVTQWVCEHLAGDLPVYLMGLSMGATTVLMTAGFPALPEQVKGVVADCGFTSPGAIWKHVMEDNLKLSYRGLRQREVNALCKKMIGMESSCYSTLDAMKENTRVPILFIHGTDDHFVPVQMTVENYEACRAPKKLLIVPGADHALSYLLDREKYEAITKEFFAEHDGDQTVEA